MEAGTRILLGILFITATMDTALTHESIMGRREPCSNEGEEVAVDSIKDMKCFKCICQNGFVECEQENCPAVDDCYMLEKKNGCCEKCKECIYKGERYASGAEWSDPDDPCASFKCMAGVVTESNMQCYTPCNNPLSPRKGQCCSTCLGCSLNGQTVQDGREVTLSEDPCLKCSCSNRRLTCVKKACPVLQCPPSKQIKLPGECCPKCSEKRQVKPFPGRCILGKGFYDDGRQYSPDKCSTCTCVNGTSICRRETCPVLECSPTYQKLTPGECCPHCPPVAKARSTCTHDGKTYQNNDTWNLDSCRSCRCHEGEIRCAQAKCPTIKCRPNETLVKPDGQCCGRCEESAGICTVFGDPHYKTFDGKFFSFQGSCKYQLTADCMNQSFSIRVTNDARSTKSSSWIKTVTLKMPTIRVNLGRKMRVKVNGTRITPPYKLDNLLDIQRTDEGISVNTEIGINLLWDGSNFLQVQAATSYKKKLCGLCGNYNNVYRDDLTSRRGINYTDDVWRFANSWKVGGIKACSRKHENLAKSPICRLKKGGQFCKPLRESEIFDDCGTRLNPEHYFESCRKDMCECPSGKCYCDSFSAYAHECKRVGGFVSDNWRRETGCEHNSTTALSTNLNRWIPASSSQATNQLLSSHSKSHRNRQKLRRLQHGNSMRFNHHHHQQHRKQHFPLSSTFDIDNPDFVLRPHDQEQIILSQHVPRELRLQNHSRTPPPLV
ncbi:BMP-binding endothelial regulator protein [Contarinia nasturtii]|uniref:BMP-binding endothelial regulator protein n=1 Tax=Contarinia nasturtii TaxID=265458 RepID=UPI0012D4172F|nr:BMP-binding endothelial regulator protein [Contarinia nasturtii]XP_031630391.1 BMP-binding endothelial regulator protein [Contarinia nasturtii]XP_031630392.1 BMP-binding endothelial regulator protein [Contarinia nasturtii]XP_031630393.1 BMP-binding endothelial regulator protein [Contarinia nasturtii]XP_031630394.1 BMP-binding endothelial regulator protein [Contarinia nasturtii]XP_031630395.1 BMP-binding endothelial regulator protein [Contarinia nasturtii]XP_031630396.1 BMP-binding endothel